MVQLVNGYVFWLVVGDGWHQTAISGICNKEPERSTLEDLTNRYLIMNQESYWLHGVYV